MQRNAIAEARAAHKEACEARMEASIARAEATNAKAVAKLCASALVGDAERDVDLEIKALVEAAMLSEDAASKAEERRVREVALLQETLDGVRVDRDEYAKAVAATEEERAAAKAAFAAAFAGARALDAERHLYLSRAADAIEAAATIATRVASAEARAQNAESALAAAHAAHAARIAELEHRLRGESR